MYYRSTKCQNAQNYILERMDKGVKVGQSKMAANRCKNNKNNLECYSCIYVINVCSPDLDYLSLRVVIN